MTRSRSPWWQATKTLKQGYLISGGWFALAVLSWFNVIYSPGALHLVSAVGLSLLSLLYASSSLMMRRVARTAAVTATPQRPAGHEIKQGPA